MEKSQCKHFGRMNDPDASAYSRGVCGDEMEFYLVIENDKIKDIKFYTESCDYTMACGEMTSRSVIGKDIDEAMKISPALVRDSVKDLPPDHIHCSILSTMTFLKALADYLYFRGI